MQLGLDGSCNTRLQSRVSLQDAVAVAGLVRFQRADKCLMRDHDRDGYVLELHRYVKVQAVEALFNKLRVRARANGFALTGVPRSRAGTKKPAGAKGGLS